MVVGVLSKTEFLILLIVSFGSWVLYDLNHPADPTLNDYQHYDGYIHIHTLIDMMDPTYPFDHYFPTVQSFFHDGVQNRAGWTGPLSTPNAYQILGVDYSASDEARKNAHEALHGRFAHSGVVHDGNRATVKAVLYAYETLRNPYVQCLYDAYIGNREGKWRGYEEPCELLWIFQRDGDITAEDQARVEGTTIEARIKREAADANAAVMYI